MTIEFDLGDAIEDGVNFLQNNCGAFFNTVGDSLEYLGKTIEAFLLIIPPWLVIAVFVGLAFWRISYRFAIFTALALLLILYGFANGFWELSLLAIWLAVLSIWRNRVTYVISAISYLYLPYLLYELGKPVGYWDATMITLGLVLSSTLISLIIGIPLGICMAKSRYVEYVVRPILDLMQTMPAFVYLIPVTMLFSIGYSVGIIATIIFAMPPAVRLTHLGIRQVNRELLEAGRSFGCTYWQLLFKVQLPNAMPSIMTGVNQCLMMSLSMVIIASMVGVEGLGQLVNGSLNTLNISLGFKSGLAVVLLAVVLDRITESFGRSQLDKRKSRIEWIKERLHNLQEN
ncbi:ABC transporter permease [Entomomonas asaccharolytica]|uniref:Proline/glycine betaine ABC transporter permease n=1 Tax=Entomomonas asaccharolytica TaxID=2785331 RepID=A0A974NDU3_9GAMM|nr:proline/glycine betaine ABC transporter permease [Entomomonas asaccharolytica]QQP84856.1 proline/glycine betaine ABC transporter permease [Entomomonas asaccharolytica]